MGGLKRRKSELEKLVAQAKEGREITVSMWGGEGRGKSERGKIYKWMLTQT